MKRQLIGIMLTAALFGVGQAQATIIDTYSGANAGTCDAYFAASGQCVASPTAGTSSPSNTNINAPGSIGGTRSLTILTTSVSGRSTAGIDVDGVAGLLYNNGSNVTSKFTTIWTPTTAVDLTKNTLPSTFANGDPTPTGPADNFVWHITAMDINLLATVILKDADGTVGGNSFLKVPINAGGSVPVECSVNPLVCVQPFVPGNLYHGFAPFNAGGTDPARAGVSFWDDPYNLGPDTNLKPTGGTTAGLDFTKIVSIQVIFDTSGNAGSNGLDLSETCIATAPLLGTAVTPGTTPSAHNHIGDATACTVVPEPSTVLLMGTGLLGVGLLSLRTFAGRRRRQA